MFLAAAAIGGPIPGAAAPPLFPQGGGGTTIYVNPETGDNCFNGLAPVPSLEPPCPLPSPPGGWDGPVKTITEALARIVSNPSIGSGPPYTVRIAARYHDGSGQAYVFGSQALPYHTGETFPLDVPPRTLLKADGPNSELAPGGAAIRVIIEGPPPPSPPCFTTPLPCTTGPCPAPPDTIRFVAGAGDYFTSEGGLDGSEIVGRGIEVRGGGRTVYLRGDGGMDPQWSQIPPLLPPPTTSILAWMFVRIDQVWFSGRSAYDLDVHIENGSFGRFTVSNCRFTTDVTYGCAVAFPGEPVHPFHTGWALIHVFSVANATLEPTFSNNEITVLPGAGGAVPDVKWGMVIEPQSGSTVFVTVSGLKLDGAATPPGTTPAGGIVAGIELASNTGNPGAPIPNIPVFKMTSSEVKNCAVYGFAVATGAFGPNTVTRLEISGNNLTGNGVRPALDTNILWSASTHGHYPGAALHLVSRGVGSWFTGSIASNAISGNRTGIGFSSNSTIPWFTIPPTEPQDLTVAGNDVSGQILHPSPPYQQQPSPGDGVGIVLGDDQQVGAGTLLPSLLVEGNWIHGNARHGAWIVMYNSASSISPVLRNNRVYDNGGATPTVGPLGDGVRIEVRPAVTSGTLAPTLVHETIVRTAGGYGVHNTAGTLSGIARPRIWNSVVYLNAGPVVPTGGPDLFGFEFGAQPTGGEVHSSDFCGYPWGVGCGSQSLPGPAGCITFDPTFVLATSSDFELTCNQGPGSPPCPAVCQSPCIDTGDPNALFLPRGDAKGADRTVTLNPGLPPDIPDMGALEKQTCSP